jgi:hypothetical protein
MGGVSPVLYWPVVPARLVKTSADVKFSAPMEIFTIFCENSKILSRLLSVLSLPRKFVYDHCCWPNSAIILTVLKMEAILEFGRGCPNLSIILLGGCGGGGGGALISTPLLEQAMRHQVAPGCTAVDLVLFINLVSLSFPSTLLCIAAAVRLYLDKKLDR